LNVTAEGQTEQEFALRVLAPHLETHNVFVRKPRLSAIGKKRGQVHRGGVLRYMPLRNDIVRWLKEDRHPDARFTTMIDLYHLPKDFPGYEEAREVSDCHQRVEKLEAAWMADIDDRRLIPYVQLHEFEALLLSSPGKFKDYPPFSSMKRQIDNLIELCAAYDTPEKIDDGEQTAPSKRIGAEIPDYLGAKPTAGPIIAAAIGISTMRAKCPHFDQWLSALEQLAGCSTPGANEVIDE
jgi:hypothetical protein